MRFRERTRSNRREKQEAKAEALFFVRFGGEQIRVLSGKKKPLGILDLCERVFVGGTCMASGPIVEEGDGTEEKQPKVYTRKAFKNSRKNLLINNNNAKTNPSATTAPAANGEKNDGENRNDNNVSSTQAPEVIGLEDGNSAQPPAPVSEDGNSAQQLAWGSEDGNSAQPQQPQSVSWVEAASGDSLSLNQQEPAVAMEEAAAARDTPAENGLSRPESDISQVKINLTSRSKKEVHELRRKLESELFMVQGLVKKIEVKQGQIGGLSYSHVSANDALNNNVIGLLRRVHSEVASGGVPPEVSRPLHQLSVSVLENSHGEIENVEKEKRTPKANQFYQSSEFLLAKDKFPPAESNKTKLNLKKQYSGGEVVHRYTIGNKFFKSCSSLLEKLMKHKHGWVFNGPVDAEKLGLHDYHIIIKCPMDLGTIKARLIKNWYKSPKEYAEDVRLTFDNAMTYNPPGQDVHVMAEQLAKIFEERWAIIESDYNRESRFGYDYGTDLPTQPIPRKAPPPPPPLDMRRILNRSESITHHSDPRPRSMTTTPRTPAPKKPKAKDPHKRDMTYEEKQKLSTSLQGLPSEKLDTIVQIIRKRNSAVFQHDDEIEVDIDSVDAETLWELDRYVTNYKKSLSKHKRKAELAMQARMETGQNVLPHAPNVEEVPNKTTTDPMIVSSSTPILRDNQGDNKSRLSSSSSSSSDSGSSSSDSDSDSSSDSGSDTRSPRT